MEVRILVVDDEAELRGLVAGAVRAMGYQADTADGVEPALALLEAEDYDVLVTDKNMPDPDGSEEGGMRLLAHARLHHPATAVLMMTGFATLDQIMRRSGITVEQAQKARDFLVDRGMFIAWYAARCPACLYTWPVCKVGEEDTLNAEITCPVCNRVTKRKNVIYVEVYEIIK